MAFFLASHRETATRVQEIPSSHARVEEEEAKYIGNALY
jgi:hypothetical protein